METNPDNNHDMGDTTFGFMGRTGCPEGENNSSSKMPSRRLAPSVAQRVVEFASHSLKELSNSEDFRIQKEESVHPPIAVHHSQFELGDLMGQGTFSDVLEIKGSRVESIEPKKYVVKMLRKSMIDDPALFAASAAGLISEATILTLLDHDNIIRVKAWSHRGLGGYSRGTSDAFFLVLDRLDYMLSDRIHEWKQEEDKIHIFARHRNEKLRQLLNERLLVAKDIASAIAYLHQRRIIHRDIKPSNIGFQQSQVKLFDFDVSRFLPEQSFEGQLFNLTALTGTRRYMSPENALYEPYNEKTDVYSFAMLLHEMITLEKAFSTWSKKEHERRVFQQNMRPPISHSFPRTIRAVIEAAWSRNIDLRPSMSEILDQLEHALHKDSSRQQLCRNETRQPGVRSVNVKRIVAQIVSIA